MQAFHNDESIKAKYLKRLKSHYEADEIIKGAYWEQGKGWAVGCTIHGHDHRLYETQLGIPKWLARVEDTIFEGLKNSLAKEWPIRFLYSIKTGCDLESIKIPFLIYVVESTLSNFNRDEFPAVKKYIDNILLLLKTNPEDKKSLREVRKAADSDAAAYSAAALAAYSAAYFAAADDDDYFAYASDSADAAANSAYFAAADDAKENSYEKFSDKLIELMKQCK